MWDQDELMDYYEEPRRPVMTKERAEGNLKHKVWETGQGNKIKIVDMTDYHLSNTIAWLERNAEYPSRRGFLTVMFKEQMRRWREG